MATRSELLITFAAALDAEGGFLLPAPETTMPDEQSKIVSTQTSIDGTKTLEWHICYFWDQSALNVRNAHFWVINRGEADEAAAWHKAQNPKPESVTTFAQQLAAWLELQVDQAFGTFTLRHIETINANNTIERATATVIMETDTGEFVQRSVAVWQNAQDEWRFQVITT